ncbi:MAG: cysteine desulfurase NifS [Clostridiales bacterium]|jgi:cysteine desulfurase|nr:cysteine desulfurase NifS [Clostridiales bacterium]
MQKHNLYLDNAATTPLHPDALAAMMPFLTERYGNPSGIYDYARETKKSVDEARRQIAAGINAKPEEIFFTCGGTEADNWAIKGAAEARWDKARHIITSAIEHHAVLHTCQYLEKRGYSVTYLPVDENGTVSPESVEKAIRPDTALVSVMLANNEVGTVEPVSAIGEITRKHGVLLHTDAVQAAGHIPIDVEALNADLLTVSAHKFYGPKGVGALYIKKGVRIAQFMHGGAQENNRRAGTENVAGIVGMGKAFSIAAQELPGEYARVSALRDRLISGIEATIPHAKLNGHRHDRLPGNVNFSFAFIEGESLLLLLDMQGCRASSGSACSSGSLDPSHVLMAMGIPHEKAHGSIRFTLGRHNTGADVDALLEILPPMIARLREMSPLYEDFITGKGQVWNTAKK